MGLRAILRIVGCSNTECEMYNVDIYDYDCCKGKCPKCNADLLDPDLPKPVSDEEEEEPHYRRSIRCFLDFHDWQRMYHYSTCRRCGQVRKHLNILLGMGRSVVIRLPVGVEGCVVRYFDGELIPHKYRKYLKNNLMFGGT